MTITTNTNKIIQEILRKYLNSFTDNGFSGVSSGQSATMTTIEKPVIQSNTKLKLCSLRIRIINTQSNIDNVDNISHLISVDA